MAERASFSAIVHGHVQGVSFRAFVQQNASSLDIQGFTRNLADGRSVEVQAEGFKDQLETLVDRLRIGPPRSRVEKIDIDWSECTNKFDGFHIRY